MEDLIIRYNNLRTNIEMNMKFIEYSLDYITPSEEELDEMMEHYIRIEDYILCDKIVKKRNK